MTARIANFMRVEVAVWAFAHAPRDVDVKRKRRRGGEVEHAFQRPVFQTKNHYGHGNTRNNTEKITAFFRSLFDETELAMDEVHEVDHKNVMRQLHEKKSVHILRRRTAIRFCRFLCFRVIPCVSVAIYHTVSQ